MGLFDALFKSKGPPEELTPEQLRERLLEAVAQSNRRGLAELCRGHRETIRSSFAEWCKLPEGLREQPAAVQRYANGLIGIASYFNQELKEPALLRLLTGPEGSNPVARWQQALESASEQMEELRYHQGIATLQDLIAAMAGQQGSAVERYLPIAHGLLGECYFQSGEGEQALAPMAEALRLCRQHGDSQGISAYLGNLYEIQRYLGAAEAAAGYAEELGQLLHSQGQPARARKYLKQARLVRAGEPLNRVVALIGDEEYELDELPASRDGQVRFNFQRNRITLRPAQRLSALGERQGQQGSYAQALDLFERAAQMDQHDPHSRYQGGFTLLHLRRYEQAASWFDQVEALAPGWFHCRSDRWIAGQLAAGALEHEAFLALHTIEDGGLAPAKSIGIAEEMLPRAPRFAPLYLGYGRSLAALGRDEQARAAYRQGLQCAEDPDTTSRLLLQLGVLAIDPAERTSLLNQVVALNGNLTAAAMARMALR